MLYYNKYAGFKYETEKEYECGMSLAGTQVKEIRDGKMNIKECNVRFFRNELFASNTGLSADKIKLLLNKHELKKISLYLDEKRHHVFAIGIFETRKMLKLKIATGIVKKQYQQTAQQKRKDVKIDMAKKLKNKEFDY